MFTPYNKALHDARRVQPSDVANPPAPVDVSRSRHDAECKKPRLTAYRRYANLPDATRSHSALSRTASPLLFTATCRMQPTEQFNQ